MKWKQSSLERSLCNEQLVKRNGGDMSLDYSDAEKDILRMEFQIA
jgi:hypothetical protein